MMRAARTTPFERAIRALLGGAFLCVGISAVAPLAVDAAGTPAGTAITNTATMTYADGAGTNYTSTSNTVTTTVQDVATATITANPATGNTIPGGQYDAIYTIANTGNGFGSFNLTFGAVTGVDAANGTVAGWQVVFPTGSTAGAIPGTCTLGATLTYLCTAQAGVVSLVGSFIVPANGAIILTLPTNVAAAAAFGAVGTDTIVTPVTTTVTYPA